MSGKPQGNARWTRLLLGTLCSLGLVLSWCIPPRPGAAAAQSERGFSIRVDVELVTAEVIVLDKKGNPVHNLKRESFQLYEDGKQQEIASFDEVTEESGLAEGIGGIRRGKTVLILFDDSTITPVHMKSTRDSAERFVKEHMRPQDVFAIVSYDLSLRVFQSFTDDPDKVLAAIRRPATSGSGRVDKGEESRPIPGQPPSREIGASSRSTDASTKYRAESFFRTLDFLSRSIERVKGRKSILLFSEDLSISNDSRSLFLKTVNAARKANVVFYTIDARGLDSNIFGNARPPGKSGETARRERSTDFGRQSEGMPGLSNGMFQQKGGGTGGGGTGGTGTGGSGTGGTGSTGGTGTGGGSTGSTGGRGTGSTGSTGTTTSPGYIDRTNTGPWQGSGSEFGSDSMRMEQDILRSLASETGGFPIYNTSSFDQELDKLDQQLSNYYVLGFQSSNPKRDGSLRKIEVKTNLKGMSLKYRKNYVDRRPLDTLASSKQEKILLNAMESRAAAIQLPLNFRAAYFYDSPRLARVLVASKISLEKAEFKKKSGQMSCDLNVMGVAYAENDAVAARFSETVPVVLDKDKAPDLPKTILYSNYFKLRPGKYRLKLAASDGASNLGSMEQSLDIPALPENGIGASSLVIADRVSQLPALIQNIEARLLDDSDPLVHAGIQLSPSIENRLPANAPLAVLFRLYSPAGGLDQGKSIVKATLLSETGKELPLPPFAIEGGPSGDTVASIGFTLTFQDVSPGKYRLVIETTDAKSSQTATVQTDLELVNN